jgi:hypothetical protein
VKASGVVAVELKDGAGVFEGGQTNGAGDGVGVVEAERKKTTEVGRIASSGDL